MFFRDCLSGMSKRMAPSHRWIRSSPHHKLRRCTGLHFRLRPETERNKCKLAPPTTRSLCSCTTTHHTENMPPVVCRSPILLRTTCRGARGPVITRYNTRWHKFSTQSGARDRPQVAVLYQAIDPPIINGVRKPKKPGGEPHPIITY